MINQPPAANTRFQKYAKHSLKFFFHLLVYTFIPKSSKKNPPKLDVNNLFAFFFELNRNNIAMRNKRYCKEKYITSLYLDNFFHQLSIIYCTTSAYESVVTS